MRQKTRDDHLFGPGPKRLLALDGGGVRGIVALAYLRRVEHLLRERCGGDPEFRLCDYFDLIGGTSTGAIIAAALAVGYPVERIVELYRTMMPQVFKTSRWRIGLRRPKYARAPLAGDGKRFQIVEEPDDLFWIDPASNSSVRDSLAGKLRLLDIFEDQGDWIGSGTVAYGSGVYDADFELLGTGMVNMLNDVPVATDLPIHVESFDESGVRTRAEVEGGEAGAEEDHGGG